MCSRALGAAQADADLGLSPGVQPVGGFQLPRSSRQSCEGALGGGPLWLLQPMCVVPGRIGIILGSFKSVAGLEIKLPQDEATLQLFSLQYFFIY